MEAKEMLMSEHRIVERFVDTLERAAEMLDQNMTVRPGLFVDAADFSKGFTDGCHHRKEEGYLFPAMMRNDPSEAKASVAELLSEHEQARKLVKAMRVGALQWQEGDSSAKPGVIKNAHDYVTLLRSHVKKEDVVVFPLSEEIIPLDEQERLAEDFERVEEEEVGAGVHEKYLDLAGRLKAELD